MGQAEQKIKIIVLAAGHGKRMGNGELPKVLVLFKDKPLVHYVMEAIAASRIDVRPIVVVGQKSEQVKAALGSDYIYVLQTEQRGTGHAVAAAESVLKGKAETVMVLYGDQPLITPITIKKMAQTHIVSGSTVTMATVLVPDFGDWRQGFYDFGRVIRDKAGKVVAIVEKKDATLEQLDTKEVNPSYFCFKAQWLWQNLEKLSNNNSQREYYLTDLVGLACQQGEPITTVMVELREALGVNTPEQLVLLKNARY
ncbi:MAG: NTP transferase domain-containing protein [Candidatus Kerfeldbacteria bacterium]|nr:NTP transferase domain-containing protein [Candidatus Kerfeldbacteria bacterium]